MDTSPPRIALCAFPSPSHIPALYPEGQRAPPSSILLLLSNVRVDQGLLGTTRLSLPFPAI